jgi:cytochrome c553
MPEPANSVDTGRPSCPARWPSASRLSDLEWPAGPARAPGRTALQRTFSMQLSHTVGFVVAVAAGLTAATVVHAADPAAGREKAAMCQTCHGIDGIARIPEAPTIAGESELYLEKQLEAFRSGEREDPMMSIIAQSLSDEDIDNLAAWYASIEITATIPD